MSKHQVPSAYSLMCAGYSVKTKRTVEYLHRFFKCHTNWDLIIKKNNQQDSLSYIKKEILHNPIIVISSLFIKISLFINTDMIMHVIIDYTKSF